MWIKELIKKKDCYPSLPMRKDQANWTEVYKMVPLGMGTGSEWV